VKIPGHDAGEDAIPLLGDKSKPIDKPEMDIVISEDGGLARISGRIDMNSSPALRAHLLTMLGSPRCKAVSIDLSAVTQMDSSGVATLIEGLKVAQSYDTEVKLQGLEGRLLRLFQLTGILSLFNGSTRANSQAGYKAV
jgi:anti-sigma B factor antagonist